MALKPWSCVGLQTSMHKRTISHRQEWASYLYMNSWNRLFQTMNYPECCNNKTPHAQRVRYLYFSPCIIQHGHAFYIIWSQFLTLSRLFVSCLSLRQTWKSSWSTYSRGTLKRFQGSWKRAWTLTSMIQTQGVSKCYTTSFVQLWLFEVNSTKEYHIVFSSILITLHLLELHRMSFNTGCTAGGMCRAHKDAEERRGSSGLQDKRWHHCPAQGSTQQEPYGADSEYVAQTEP